MIYRLIAPKWLDKPILEGEFSDDKIRSLNNKGYNVYYFPNYPFEYQPSTSVSGNSIDVFNWVFVDCDLKDKRYGSKEEFYEKIARSGFSPTKIVDSGNGVHVYWKIQNLDAKSYLRFQRRLVRMFDTDEATTMLVQLLRAPGTINTKDKDNPKPCLQVFESSTEYTAEEFDKLLPPITLEDEAFCVQHYDRTYGLNQDLDISDTLPSRFGDFLHNNAEAKELFTTSSEDRSKSDYRLAHLMFADGFSREEAASVLVNCPKALERAPVHRNNYAKNIVDKIWTFEEKAGPSFLSESVESILSRGDDEYLKGKRFPCYPYFDGTEDGFRLTQVIGLCAGVGVGKTAIGLNKFKGFVERNPDFIHMFISLEQPNREIAKRWKKMCGKNTGLHNKVHVLGNYNDDGSYRNLSLTEIQEYILDFEKRTGAKVGCVCIDHIGILKQEKKPGEYQGLRDICSQMKSFAVATETLLIMQSQTNRDKAGIGDLELFKNAAYGTQNFESYCDFLLVAWQPLKRVYDNQACPRVTAYKFCKIRHKSKRDIIIEDQCYRLFFEQDTETLRPMTQDEETSFDYFANQALALRKKDRKTDLVRYTSVKW